MHRQKRRGVRLVWQKLGVHSGWQKISIPVVAWYSLFLVVIVQSLKKELKLCGSRTWEGIFEVNRRKSQGNSWLFSLAFPVFQNALKTFGGEVEPQRITHVGGVIIRSKIIETDLCKKKFKKKILRSKIGVRLLCPKSWTYMTPRWCIVFFVKRNALFIRKINGFLLKTLS